MEARRRGGRPRATVTQASAPASSGSVSLPAVVVSKYDSVSKSHIVKLRLLQDTQNLMKGLSHIDVRGEACMVDVTSKPILHREAVARGEIRMRKSTLKLIRSQRVAKGNVLAAARLAGILAAKKTGELIPLCHPLPLTHCEVNFEIPAAGSRIVITAVARIAAQTGVEMEALTAVTVAALTVYDMCKAVDKQMRLTDIKLLSKTKR